MDSGNSSSLQSSSGGDEEYESRPDSLPPSFLNSATQFPHHHLSNPQPGPSLLPHHHQQQQPSSNFFDSSHNLFHSFSHSPPNVNPNLLNLEMVRSRPCLRSDIPTSTDLAASHSILGSSRSTSTQELSQPPLSSMQLRSVQDNGAARSSPPSDHQHQTTQQAAVGVARNPKKRTRASRRAPTTVLTTDTSNFRAMVQEFTGIPAPPFSAGTPYSRRLDLFGPSAASSGLGSLYHHPLRPSPQKVPFLSSSSSLASSSSFLNTTLVDSTNTVAAATARTSFNIPIATSSSINYQNMVTLQNNQNQILSFNSLLHPLPPSLNVPGLGAKSQPSLPLASLEELGLSHGLSGLPMSTDGNNNNSNQDHLRSLNSCKFNFSAAAAAASSSESFRYHHEKGLDNVNNVSSSRGEATTVDSWICPSE